MLINRFKVAAKSLIGRNYAGRNVITYPDDIMLASYPKSGNTWTRFLVANLISSESVTFNNIEKIVPDIYQWDNAYLQRIERSRILKSHECFDPKYHKVIYIVRDPRDVVISYWFHCIKFDKVDANISLDDFVDLFVYGKLDTYGSWGENVGSWLGARHENSNFILVRYEDLIMDSPHEMRRIAALINCDSSDDNILQAISNSSLDKMKAMERKNGSQWKALANSKKKDMPFVRKGQKGGWKDELSVQSINKIEMEWGALMAKLGYLN